MGLYIHELILQAHKWRMYQDYLTFDKYIRDEKRRLFKLRFEKLYDNNKNNINKPIFWAWNLIW